MPTVSFGEVLIILLVIVLFVKPEELPGFLRKVGRIYGQFLGYIDQVRGYTRDTYRHVSTLDQPVKEALNPPPPTKPAEAPPATTTGAEAAPSTPPAAPLTVRPPLGETFAVPSAAPPRVRPARRRGPRLFGPPRRPPPADED